ncbi:hypothetical protein CBL_07333 [Carabus blaptoides fortunei]
MESVWCETSGRDLFGNGPGTSGDLLIEFSCPEVIHYSGGILVERNDTVYRDNPCAYIGMVQTICFTQATKHLAMREARGYREREIVDENGGNLAIDNSVPSQRPRGFSVSVKLTGH